ncbi:hypothetical protein BRD05_10355 [Halobacteriales archaeon QS_9_70_65]|nr:MAG: hypothetical protein BRD05_10355 [Halobacteriales archaeon QS_9_70_65]
MGTAGCPTRPERHENIDRSFVADHSALADGIGTPTPTDSGRDGALRIADRFGGPTYRRRDDT